MSRIAALSDVHGNAVALEAMLADVAKAKPDAVLIAGDLVLNGPEPALVIDVLRSLADDGALIVSGNTDIAVADFDFAAAFPWMTDGVPDAIVDAAEWAHEALGQERIDWIRRLPSERRWRPPTIPIPPRSCTPRRRRATTWRCSRAPVRGSPRRPTW